MVEIASFINLIWGGLVMGSLYALVAVGLTLIYGAASVVNLAHGEFLMLGAYMAYWPFVLMGIPPLLSIIFVGLISAGIGAAIYFGVFSRLHARGLPNIQFQLASVILTFGIIYIVVNSSAWAWSPDYKSYSYLMQGVNFLGLSTILSRLTIPVICIPLVLVIYVAIKKTWFGGGIRCVIENEDAARLIGVNVRRVYLHCFILGFALAGIGGVLYSMNFIFTPYIGLDYTMTAWVVMILGGVGSITGALIGGLIIGIVESTLCYALTPALKIPIIYSILIIVLLLRPKGLFGKKVGY